MTNFGSDKDVAFMSATVPSRLNVIDRVRPLGKGFRGFGWKAEVSDSSETV